MCFRIDFHATRPRKKIVWKVVELYRERVRSLMHYRHKWYPGTFEIRKNAVTSGGMFGRAREGYYVYLNREDAKRRLIFAPDDYVLLKLEVDPDDWLHSERRYADDKPRIATYRRVTVPENQPDLEFFA
jgi:hypothetical protein